MSAVVAGKFNHGDGSFDVALGVKEADGDAKGGFKVVVFPEPGSGFDIHHNVPEGDGDGEFSPA